MKVIVELQEVLDHLGRNVADGVRVRLSHTMVTGPIMAYSGLLQFKRAAELQRARRGRSLHARRPGHGCPWRLGNASPDARWHPWFPGRC